MNERAMGKGKDLFGARWTTWLLWDVPVVLMVGTGSIGLSSVGTSSIGNIIHTTVWTFSFTVAGVSFTVAGVACLVNARRCGRLHCSIPTRSIFSSCSPPCCVEWAFCLWATKAGTGSSAARLEIGVPDWRALRLPLESQP